MKRFFRTPLAWLFHRSPLFVRRWHFMRYKLDHLINSEAGTFRARLEAAFARFLDKQERENQQKLRELTKDIVNCYLLYKATPDEYFLFDFAHKSPRERAAYLTDYEKCHHIDFSLFHLTRDKALTYEKLKPFYKRLTVAVRDENDKQAFLELAQQSPHLFVKDLCGALGQGAKVLEIHGQEEAEHAFSELLAQKAQWQVEELIRQTSEMAAWNPDSVNTVRIPSILVHGECKLLNPIFRTGTKGVCADNGGNGGIASIVDKETGIVITNGLDTSLRQHEEHPDTGLTYKGFQIPEWQELLATAKQAHLSFSAIRYLSFDFAHTAHGWILVEANGCGGLTTTQVLCGPIKEQFIGYMKAR